MLNLLIKNATIIDGNSKWHNKKVDVLIKNGKIDRIAKTISSNFRKISFPGLHVSRGWYDLKSNFRDPGFEYKEDVISGLNAAAAGGYTRVCASADTHPVIDDKSKVQYLLSKSKGHVCDLSVTGAISVGLKGKELAEMYDMRSSGATLFGDGNHNIQNAGLMKKALLYAKSFGAGVVSNPIDSELAGSGEINEGVQSVMMGLAGVPAIAEIIALNRDINLLEYAGGRMHVMSISTKESVELVKKAKKEGLNITAGVSIAHLIKTDKALEGYDVNYKTWPPLRTESDRMALVKGVLNGTIDVIVSDHMPEDEEEKKVEFSQAAFGMISLETVFGLYGALLQQEIPLEVFVKCVTVNPYLLTQEDQNEFDVGSEANLTLFSPQKEWVYSLDSIKSKSKNSPFIDELLTGKVWGVINNKKTTL